MKKSIFILFVVFAFFQLQSVVEVRLRESEDRLTKTTDIRNCQIIIIKKGKFKLLDDDDFGEIITKISNFYEDGHTFNFFYEDKEKKTKIDGMYWQFGLQDVNGVCVDMTLDSLGVFRSFVGLKNLKDALMYPVEVFCSLKDGKEEVFRISVLCDDEQKLSAVDSTLRYCLRISGKNDHFEKITMQNRFLWLFTVTPIMMNS